MRRPRAYNIRGSLGLFWLAAIVLAGCLSACGEGNDVATAASGPGRFVGLVSEDVIAGKSDYRREVLHRQRALGVGYLRQTFDWSQVERRKGRYSFGRLDGFMADLARERMGVLPVIFNPPRFRSSAPASGAKRGTYPPRDPMEMGAFATRLVRRYGPDGSFWRSHRSLPKMPIRTWQVWNEPNLPAYWPSGPDPAAYVALLRATGAAIKAADPGAEVVTGGLPESPLGIPFVQYVEGMYGAGARGTFDTLAIHPYAADAPATLAAAREARNLMDASGDDAGLRITELGWASGGPASAFTVGKRGQAERVGAAIRSLARERDQLRLKGVVYFGWRDARPFPGSHDFWGLHTGLLDLKGREKPAYQAFARAVP